MLFHFAPRRELADGERDGTYAPAAFATDGFVHCSYPHQVGWVASRMAPGAEDLVLLEIDPERVVAPVRVEGGFPHV